MNNLEIINPVDSSGWDEKILNFSDYSFFHTSYWSQLVADTYGYHPYYFIIQSHNSLNAAVPVMVVNSRLTGNRAVALPFTDYCPPLISDDINFSNLQKEILDFCKKRNLKYVEIRGGNKFFNGVQPSTFDYNHSLNLTIGEDELHRNLSSNTKRNIKKSIREGVSTEISNSREALEEFYKMNCITRKKHGLPPQPKSFFENLFKYVLSSEKGFIAIGCYKDLSIAGAVYLLHGKKAVYKFGASDMEYQHLRANNLVMWEAIKYCANNGFEDFCFGRTEPDNEGLRKFKLGWGTKEEVLNIYRYDLRKDDFIEIQTKTTGLHNKIFNCVPLPLLKVFGSLTYRHFG
ncbi:MAG: peptidoglycan bridge formation glycyltransferase FemA/FemB family protein [Ignavibacterium sp.]|nr:MAG: peptidoglycan bridge formation glycyltransferase FemA/FemB family protein [Ignavibacterium sp.]